MPELSVVSSSAPITPRDAVRKLIQAQQDTMIEEKIYEVKPQSENEYYFGHNALTQEECMQLIGPTFMQDAQKAISESTDMYREGVLRKEILPEITLVVRVVDEGDPFGETPNNPHVYVVKDSYGAIPANKGQILDDVKRFGESNDAVNLDMSTDDVLQNIPVMVSEDSHHTIADNVELLRRRFMEVDPTQGADEATVLALNGIQLGVNTPDRNGGSKVSINIYYETATGKIGYFQPGQQVVPGTFSRFHSQLLNHGRQFAQDVDENGNVQWHIVQQGTNEILIDQILPERLDPVRDEKQKTMWGESSPWGESAAGDSVFKKSLEEFNNRFGPQQ